MRRGLGFKKGRGKAARVLLRPCLSRLWALDWKDGDVPASSAQNISPFGGATGKKKNTGRIQGQIATSTQLVLIEKRLDIPF